MSARHLAMRFFTAVELTLVLYAFAALDRYYAEIEARAFGEEVDLEQIEDKTLPLAEQMQKVRLAKLHRRIDAD